MTYDSYWETYHANRVHTRREQQDLKRRFFLLDFRVSQGPTPFLPTLQHVMQWTPEEDMIFRVWLDKRTNTIEVVCLGMNSVDTTVERVYRHSEDLPKWIQEKLSVLMMIECVPPMPVIEGVGMRVTQDTFWVFHDGAASPAPNEEGEA